jgi:hypothetical protein
VKRFGPKPRIRPQRPNTISHLRKGPRLAFRGLGRPSPVAAGAPAERPDTEVMQDRHARAVRSQIGAEKRQPIRDSE